MEYSIENGYQLVRDDELEYVTVTIDLHAPPLFWRAYRAGDPVAVSVPSAFVDQYVHDWIIRHADLFRCIDPGDAGDYIPILTGKDPREWVLCDSLEHAQAFIRISTFPRPCESPMLHTYYSTPPPGWFSVPRRTAWNTGAIPFTPDLTPVADEDEEWLTPRNVYGYISSPQQEPPLFTIMGVLDAVPRFRADGLNGERANYISIQFAAAQKPFCELPQFTADIIQHGCRGSRFITDDVIPSRIRFVIQGQEYANEPIPDTVTAWRPQAPNIWELGALRRAIMRVEFDFYGPMRYHTDDKSVSSIQELLK
jgi:hypothetical protein